VAPAPSITRAIVIVLDSAGVGELPDAAAYGDEGSNTLGNIARAVSLRLPTLCGLGLGEVVEMAGASRPAAPGGAFAKLAEASAGKDSVTGHWELMGIVLDRPFVTFPTGFPPAIIAEFERRIGRPTLGNVVASGTRIIEQLGDEHVRTGRPIVYTSADSVFQIAAHERVVPVPELYRWCEVAFDIVAPIGVGRVIARPFAGAPGHFERTANRHDFAQTPPAETLLDRLTGAGWPVVAIGKINDLFAGRGITRTTPTRSDLEGLDVVEREMGVVDRGLIVVNLVECDTL
jgi:phosphopentomutase